MDVIRLVIILLLIIALIILCVGTLGDCLQHASGPHRMYLSSNMHWSWLNNQQCLVLMDIVYFMDILLTDVCCGI